MSGEMALPGYCGATELARNSYPGTRVPVWMRLDDHTWVIKSRCPVLIPGPGTRVRCSTK
eukprot:30864-Rhodomonas_salina.1